MKKTHYASTLLILSLVLMGASCVMGQQDNQQPAVDQSDSMEKTEQERMDEQRDKMEKEKNAVRTFGISMAQQNQSGVTGITTLSNMDGKAKVEMSLKNPPAGVLTAEIRKGTCKDLSDLLYDLGDVPGQKLEIVLDDSIQIVLGKSPLVVTVYDGDAMVSCGKF